MALFPWSYKPTLKEISQILSKLKNSRAPGEDGIPAALYKSCLSVLLEPLHSIISAAWDQEICPEDWGKSIILPLYKKGDQSECGNYRGISLLNVAAKVFAKLVLTRFCHERDSRTRPTQAGFRSGKGCVNQIFTLRRVLEHRHKYQQPTVACFIDFRTAFDSVDRSSLWRIMKNDGMPDKLINLIKEYEDKDGVDARSS